MSKPKFCDEKWKNSIWKWKFSLIYFANRRIKCIGTKIDDNGKKLLGKFGVSWFIDQQSQKFQKSLRKFFEKISKKNSFYLDTAEWAFGLGSRRTVRTLSLQNQTKKHHWNRIESNFSHILNAVKVFWRIVWTNSFPICVRKRSKLIKRIEITAVSQSKDENRFDHEIKPIVRRYSTWISIDDQRKKLIQLENQRLNWDEKILTNFIIFHSH